MASGTLDLLGGLALPSLDPPPLPPQTPTSSQLTIFYSGTVNVYNDVPADKAHAIMLLLANGDDRQNRSMDTKDAMASPMIPRAPLGTSTIFKQPLSRASTPPPPPLSPFSSPQPERKPQLLGKRTQAELPFARKASLARFLERRKDRVHAIQEASAEEGIVEDACKKLKGCDDDTSSLK